MTGDRWFFLSHLHVRCHSRISVLLLFVFMKENVAQ